MPQQTLNTERLTLVPLADQHLEWEVELDSDPDVMRYLSGQASTREDVEAGHARRMAAAERVDGLGFWVGLVDDEFVGWSALQPAHGTDQPDDPGVADLGYRLLQRHWRKGLASDGARELVRHGFDDVGLDRIIARTITVNRLASRDRADRSHLRANLPHLYDRAHGGPERRRSGIRNDARAMGAPHDLAREAR
jgi:RimJ/RimL family protein N-acetyltransferase